MGGATTLDSLTMNSTFLLGMFVALLVGFFLERAGGKGPDQAAAAKEREMARYNAPYTLAGVWRNCLLGGIGGAIAFALLTGNMLVPFFIVLIGFIIPLVYPGWIRRGYMASFEDGFSECLDVWVRCLQAGLSLQQAVEAAANDLEGPAANEMRTLRKEMSLGDTESALWHLYDRVPVEDVKYAVLGVITCRQTGGRMSEVVTNIAGAIRERQAQRERIQAITSMGRTEAYVMAAMPFAIGGMMYYLQPDTTSYLFTHIYGIIGSIVAVCWEAVGLLIIWHIVNVKP